ncbi:MAG: 1-acyl-sn-glycerol-3-phosphate acyltransferase [Alphaproteobacteria bacterium]|nr:1-acyl-sn-glycerol-3-phosphate acyltransferase [Alphaproteobacteria bacterium]
MKNPNIFNYTSGTLRFTLFTSWTVLNLVIGLFIPKYTAIGPKFLRFYMRGTAFLIGIKIRVHGKLSDERPLMIVGNHISLFEFVSFPIAFGNSFFSKKEAADWPFIGWLMKKFGVVFIDRNPHTALATLAKVCDQMNRATWPMGIYPEGTTTNGAYVLPFKSAMFNFLERDGHMCGATVQPVAMFYRNRDGSKISDTDLAEHYAYFANAKQTQGPKCSRERGLISQMFHIFVLGGFMVEIHVLPPPPLAEFKNRKELADVLGKIVGDEYMKLK